MDVRVLPTWRSEPARRSEAKRSHLNLISPNEYMDPLTLLTLTKHIARAMEIAEGAIQSGDKAQYAQEIILRLIAESAMTEEEKILCRAIVGTGILQGIFTLVSDATKGKINVNQVKKNAKKCCLRVFPCCGKPEHDGEAEPEVLAVATAAPDAAPAAPGIAVSTV